MLKRSFSLLLASLLILSMSIPALGADDGDGVTVNITGETAAISTVIYDGADGENYYIDEEGVQIEVDDAYQIIGPFEGIPTQLDLQPGGEMRFFMDAGYDITVENGSVTENYVFTGYYGENDLRVFRQVDLEGPESGEMTLLVEPTEEVLP